MSDIEFLSIKEFGGKLVKNEGARTTTGTLATLTASGGKDMYIARAKVSLAADAVGNNSADLDKVELQIDGTAVESAIFTWVATAANTTNVTFEYEFKNIGHKVAAAGVIRLEVITLDADTTVEGFIECFEETTGESPQIS